jgi:hypothetical protein
MPQQKRKISEALMKMLSGYTIKDKTKDSIFGRKFG